jgi:hypothetical protein
MEPRIAEGTSARIQARISAGVAGAGPDLLVAARVFRTDPRTGRASGDAVALVPLRTRADLPRTFESAAPPLPPGTYAIQLDVPQLVEALHLEEGDDSRAPGRKLVSEAPLHVLARKTSERIELAAVRDPLDQLATTTGGRVLGDFEADGLPPLLHARTRTVTRTEETRLWDQPAALVLFLAILTIEWIGRKRLGLP